MSFLKQLRREVLQVFGLEGNEPPRLILDILLGAAGYFAFLILLALSFEKHPADHLKEHGILPGIVLLLVILLSKYRYAVALSIAVTIGARGLVVVLLYGYWPGLVFVGIGAIALYLLIRWCRTASY
jgi:hypothetical protein